MKPLPPAHKPAPLRKQRTLQFAELPPDQVPAAADFLERLGQIDITTHPESRSIDIGYDLYTHSLQEVEDALQEQGFHLQSSLLNKLMRALYYYVEETELHNLEAPDHPLKKSQSEVYTQVWEKHPHGDHDDTPPEWREYK